MKYTSIRMTSESALHIALKKAYLLPGSTQETWVDGYWIDVVQADRLVEIQTRSFSSIKSKLYDLISRHQVLLVHPIPIEKWIVTLTSDGSHEISRRKSPRKGRWEHVFLEMIRFPDLLNHSNFSMEIVLTREEEIRQNDGRGSWRRKGISIIDRKLLDILDRRLFTSPLDYIELLPKDLPGQFTNQQLADRLHIPVRLASKMSYCLRTSGILYAAGKQGRRLLYTISTE